MFTTEQIAGLEWLQFRSQWTPRSVYRVEVTWALDKFRVTVFLNSNGCRLQVKHARFARTATTTANKFIRAYSKREAL